MSRQRPIIASDLNQLRIALESFESRPLLTQATTDQYANVWRAYAEFCRTQGIDPYTPHGAVAWIAHRFDRTKTDKDGRTVPWPVAPATMHLWCAAVAEHCRQLGLSTPLRAHDDATYFIRVMQGYHRMAQRLRGGPAKAAALEPDVLRTLLRSPRSGALSDLRGGAAANLHLMHDLSVSDLCQLASADWKVLEPGVGVLTAPSRSVTLACVCVSSAVACTFCALERLACAGPERPLLMGLGHSRARGPAVLTDTAAVRVALRRDLRTACAHVTAAHFESDAVRVEAAAAGPAMLAVLHAAHGTLFWLRDRAALTVSFHLGFRSSDVCDHLDRGNVNREPAGYRIDLTGWKARPDGVAHYGLKPTDDPVLCPVNLLDEWIVVRDAMDGATPSGQPLFTTVAARNRLDVEKRMDWGSVASGLDRLVAAAGVSMRLTPHSARVGFAETASLQGATDHEIAEALRHAKLRTTWRYTLPVDAKRASAARRVLGGEPKS